MPPPFLLGLCYFSICWSSWTPLGPISARFWRVWASILEVFGLHFGSFWSRFGSHVPCKNATFLSCSFLKLPLVLCGVGLVGLREAQRICGKNREPGIRLQDLLFTMQEQKPLTITLIRFRGGILEKRNSARTIDTLADGT